MLSLIFSILVFVSAALAQTPDFDPFLSPVNQSTFTVGQILPISWTPTAPAGKINLTLIGGPSASELEPIAYIAFLIPSTLGNYSWPITDAIGTFASYGINLTLDSGADFQYSNQFYINGGTPISGEGGSTVTVGVTSTSTETATGPSTSSTVSSNLTLTSQTPTATVTKTSSTSSGTPSPTKNPGGKVGVGSFGALGVAGAAMVFLL